MKPKERILAALIVIALPLGAHSIWQVRQFQQGQEWLTKADHLEHGGKPKEAIAAYQKALAYYPYFTEATLELAELFEEEGSWSEAEATFTKALQVSTGPSVAVLYRQRGMLFLQQQLFEKAEADFSACLKLDPNEGLAIQGQRTVREFTAFVRQGVKSRQVAVLGDSWAAGTSKLEGLAPRLAPLLPMGWTMLDLSLQECTAVDWEKSVATAIQRHVGIVVLWKGQDELAKLCALPANPERERRQVQEFAQHFEEAAICLQQAGCHGWVGLLDTPPVEPSERARQLTHAYNQELRKICTRYHLRWLEPGELPLKNGRPDDTGYRRATKAWWHRLQPWLELKGLGAASAKPE